MICIICMDKETKENEIVCETCSHRAQLEQAFIQKGYAECECFDIDKIPFDERREEDHARLAELERIMDDLNCAVQALYSIWDMHRKGQKPIPLEEVKKELGM